MKRLVLLAFCAAFTTQAHAQIDTDNDGLSDIWEAQHGFHIGPNPPASEATGDDPDGDGFTNLAESRAGTGPHDNTSFPGHTFSLIPPVYEALPPQTAPAGDPPTDPFDPNYTPPPPYDGPPPVLIDPPVSILTWPTVPGKTYEAIPSEDLADWSANTGAFLGDGTPHTFESETLYPGGIVPPKLFWRVEINDTDSDLDGLTDYEELHITDPANPTKTLDPFNPDTDGDGIPDGDEYIPGTNGLAAFTNFLSGDPDGPHGLPASLESGLIARWDLEGTHIAPSQAPYYTLARYGDSVGSNHLVPFQMETKPDGMPSKSAGTTNNSTGFLCPPKTLLGNRIHYTVSLWAKMEPGTIASQAVAPGTGSQVALFTHHKREYFYANGVPQYGKFRIKLDGMWIERNPQTSQQILRAGTYNYRNYNEQTGALLFGDALVNTFEGVTAIFPAGHFDDGKYHHYAFLLNNANVSVYRDGQLVGAQNNINRSQIQETVQTFAGISFGRFYGDPAESGVTPFNNPTAIRGNFDRIRVWNRAITAAEAESLYKQDVDEDGLWDITEERTRKWDDHNLNAIVEPGEFAFVANPLLSDPEGSDHDLDGITSVREQNETLTDIAKADSDGDGLPDGFEDQYRPNLDPLVVNEGSLDPDGDGLTTAQEYAGGTNPTLPDAHLYPPTWISVERSLRYDYDDYGLAYETAPKKLTSTATWPGAVPTNEDPLPTMIPYADLGNILAQRQPFPASFPDNKISPTLEAGGSAVTVPTPPCHHAFLTHRRIIVKVAAATPEAREFTAILLTERTIDGIEQPDEAETLTLTVPPNATQSYPYDLIPTFTFTGGGIGSGAYSETVKQEVKHISIVPADGQVGITGDIVESNKGANGEKHFVSPKKNPQSPEDYVVLKVGGIDLAQFEKTFEWDGGLKVPNEPMQRRVRRNATGKTVVTIREKQDQKVVSLMNVWVVWADITVVKIAGPTVMTGTATTPTINVSTPCTYVESDWKFEGIVSPISIFDATSDIPDLDQFPESNVPAATHPHVIDAADIAPPSLKWDISRQVRIKQISTIIGKNDLSRENGIIHDALPAAQEVVVVCSPDQGANGYPLNPLEGNDDSMIEEDSLPYFNEVELLGKLLDKDRPRAPVVINKAGPVGTTIEFRYQFIEFARLEIGKKWFLISDPKPFRMHSKLKKVWTVADDLDGNGAASAIAGGFWEGHYIDDGSVADMTNNDW